MSLKEFNNDLWSKATNVAKGISRLIWTHKYFYIYPHIEEDLKEFNVYLNEHDKLSVKLDDGSEFYLIQPCPHLIYQLYEAKMKSDNGDILDDKTAIKVKAYEKFENFFRWMISYSSISFAG